MLTLIPIVEPKNMCIFLLKMIENEANLKSKQFVQSPLRSKFPYSIAAWSSIWIGVVIGRNQFCKYVHSSIQINFYIEISKLN